MACAAALAIVIVLVTGSRRAEADPVIAEFRATERVCIRAFNDALHHQAANDIDELGLATAIDRDVLPPWRQMRAHVDAVANIPERRRALFETLRRYLADRQAAWEAYSAALRAPSEIVSRPLLDTYHQKNSQAQDEARAIAPQLP
ncbi:MAG: hypothetical protein JWO36_2223 [Myxococcales bacterium]|nr:hypothetical protein [Myxococcales bacterium]